MPLYESAEDYLERILMLEETLGINKVHSIDVANSFSYSKASVSVAMKHLREQSLITFSKTGEISLTPKGREIATNIYERHQVLTKWIMSLGVSKEIAEKDACKIEHDLSQETYDAVKKISH